MFVLTDTSDRARALNGVAVSGFWPRSLARGLVLAVVLGGLASCSFGSAASISPAGLPPTLSFQLVDGGRVAMQSGQPIPSFGPQPRLHLNLDSGWRFQAADLNEDLSFAPRKQSLSALVREAAGRDKVGFDDSAWQAATVPGSVNPPPRRPVTDGWYRVTFTPPTDWTDKAITLKFGSVNYLADVWLNGTYLGYHEGGWTPFAFDARKVLMPGVPNTLAVRFVDPIRGTRLDIVPWGLADSWDYAGITGPVWLEASDPLHVVRADVVPHLDSADVSVVLQNSGDQALDNVTVTVEVLPAAVTDASLLDEIADAFAAADGAAVFRVVNRVIEGGHEPRRFARVVRDDDLADARSPARPPGEQPIPLAEGRLHAPPGHGDPEQQGRRSHFLVAQKMSEISLTAAWRSAAAFASTLCLFFEQSFAAFQKVSCSFGYFSRCSGLK